MFGPGQWYLPFPYTTSLCSHRHCLREVEEASPHALPGRCKYHGGSTADAAKHRRATIAQYKATEKIHICF